MVRPDRSLSRSSPSTPQTAVFFTVASRPVVIVVMLAGAATLSRLLGPEAFGAFALAVAAFAVIEEVTQLGMPTLLAKLDVLTEREARAAGGLVLTLALAALVATLAVRSGLLALGREEAGEVASLVAILTSGLLIKGLVVPVEAQLHRALDFGVVSALTIARSAIDVGTAIGLALLGFGPFALAFGVLTERMAGGVLLLLFTRRRATIYPPSLKGWGGLVGFGGLFTASHAVGITGRFAVTATLGGVLGTAGLGYYNRAATVFTMADKALLSGIKPVIMPLFRRSLAANVPPADIYRTKLDYLAVVLWPVFAAMALMAEPLVLTVLGDQWAQVVPAARIFVLGGFLIPFVRMSMKLFAVIDRLADYLRITLAYQPIRLALVAFGATQGGVEGAAAALLLASTIRAAMIVIMLRRRTGLRLTSLARPLARAALVAGVVVAATAGGAHAGGDLPVVVRLLLGIAAATGGWLAAAAAIRHPLLADLLGLARTALARTARARA